MKILVTGADSPLGMSVCNYLGADGTEVIASVRTSKVHGSRFPGCRVIGLDLEKGSSFNSIPTDVECVVHIASAHEGTPEQLFQATALGTCHLIDSAHRLGIPKIIHISSMSVYGEINEPVVFHDTRVNHSSPYGLAKWAAECFLANAWGKVQAHSIRAPAIVGLGSRRNFLARLASAMKEKQSSIQLSNPSFLFNNIIDTQAFAAYIGHLVVTELNKYEAYPIACSVPVPLSSVVARMGEAFNYKGHVRWIESTSKPFSIDISKAISLGYAPKSTMSALNWWMSEELSVMTLNRPGF